MRWMVLSASLLLATTGLVPSPAATADPVSAPPPAGNAAQGKTIYHGKGGCAFCHGTNGHVVKKPRKTDLHSEAIAKLDPPPADVRNAKTLKAKDDAQRFASIKFGHPGTAMFPRETQLSDPEIADVVAYLAILRAEGPR